MKARFILGALVTVAILGACGQKESGSVVQPEEIGRTRTLAPILGTEQANPIQGQYIVHLSSLNKETQVSAQSIGSLVAKLGLDPKGVQVKQVYSHAMNGFAAHLSAQNVNRLRKNKAVKYLAQDGIARIAHVKASGIQSDAPWGLDRIDQENLPLNKTYSYPQTGKGIDLFVIDTGVRVSHQEFGGRARWGVNTTGDGKDYDCNQHGTVVASIAAGKTFGVAKEANIISVKTMNCDGTGAWSAIIKGIDWVVQNKKGPAILNMSLGGLAHKALDDALHKAISKGVVAVVASGNNGKEDKPYDACVNSPARVGSAITVAGTVDDDRFAWFSNSGKCVDINAPGNRIKVAGHNSDTEELEASGTSVATPFVMGAAALLLEKEPHLTPAQIESKLKANATRDRLTKVPENGHPNLLLNVRAENASDPSPKPDPKPTPDQPIYEDVVNPNSSSFQPNGTKGFQYGGGTLKANLSSDAAADLDLYLQKKIDGQWVDVEWSSSNGSYETITYNAQSGLYRWEVYASYGYGAYKLSVEK